jgi:hypothetical protein
MIRLLRALSTEQLGKYRGGVLEDRAELERLEGWRVNGEKNYHCKITPAKSS